MPTVEEVVVFNSLFSICFIISIIIYNTRYYFSTTLCFVVIYILTFLYANSPPPTKIQLWISACTGP